MAKYWTVREKIYELFWGFVRAFENGQNHSIYKFEDIEQFCFHVSLFANNRRQVRKCSTSFLMLFQKVIV